MNICRIEVVTTVLDARSDTKLRRFHNLGFLSIKKIWLRDVYTIDKKFTLTQLRKVADAISNPVTQKALIIQQWKKQFQSEFENIHRHPDRGHGNGRVEGSSKFRTLEDFSTTLEMTTFQKGSQKAPFDWAVEIGYLPGVTDNIAATTREIIEDLLRIKFSSTEGVYTSQLFLIKGKLTHGEIKSIADTLFNPIIQKAHIKSFKEFYRDGGMDFIVPKVKLIQEPEVTEVNLNVSEDELVRIGKSGIANSDGSRRGPLALSLPFMKTIQNYFKKLERNPTDIELESLAQTWSEHCKHTIFADPIDEIKNGLFKTYIKGATDKIRKNKGGNDFCVSVFKDNSGAIEFDENYLITHKVETHNSPSALDPFGGSITGIVGVNRDTIGFGLGAKPVANIYGFCFADPKKEITLFKGPNFTQKMLSSRRIMDGVIDGVNAGGNQSGIPTPSGFLYFDERYRGKPLVFVGTIGLIPKKIKGKLSYVKKAKPGDYIVMIGGRVGKDGIHGATFSSEAMDTGSPVSAVQIGDPITQKKLSDALVKEARDQLLYNSITDNGAGGLSCSVAEMAKESGGCEVDLEKVPLKYPGLEPWEIWVSESQERMTLAVPAKNWKKLHDLMEKRGVELSIIGKFNNSGKCIVKYHEKIIMDIDMQFLHYGLPKRPMKTKKSNFIATSALINHMSFRQRRSLHSPPAGGSVGMTKNVNKDLTPSLHEMLTRLNITSFSFISQQFDHLVQGSSVLPPLQGKGRVNSDATVFRPILSSMKGVILSYGLYPSYSEIDPYYMAAASIDTAVRNAVAAGADPNYLALLDNFCWCSSDDPVRLYQLKKAAQACYDHATFYNTPFISGKDSMFNDFKGFDKNGKPIKISNPPTLLISSIGVVNDITKVVSLDIKIPEDLIYILGETNDELGGSEYYMMMNEKSGSKNMGNVIPQVNAKNNLKLYKSLYRCINNGLIASSISVGRGGLGVALAKIAMGGKLGVNLNINKIPGLFSRNDYALFSESQGRIVVTVPSQNRKIFEKMLKGNSYAIIGKATGNYKFIIKGLGDKTILETTVDKLLKSYRTTFRVF